ncbi:VOC family protein [Sphingobacterium sp. E70]|nr:VOC family protein [Sphingobacterium sp. E70]ULT26370.1 VOC family protein [Sphingobacterium sp. E70]
MANTFAEKIAQAQDFLPINGTDYIEFYVGNAKQAAHYYKTAFGFQSEAYAGPETGIRDRASYVLKQDKIRLVLTTALKSDHPIAEHVKNMAMASKYWLYGLMMPANHLRKQPKGEQKSIRNRNFSKMNKGKSGLQDIHLWRNGAPFCGAKELQWFIYARI